MAGITYIKNNQTNLLDVLSISLGVNREEARNLALKIANSYNSAKMYTGSDKKAAETIVQGSKSAFGVEINKQTLDTALAYVKKFENNNDYITTTKRFGDNNRRRIRISELEERAITPLNASYIDENEAQYRAHTDNGESYGAKVIPITRARGNNSPNYLTVDDAVNSPTNSSRFGNELHRKAYRMVGRTAAAIALFAYFANPFLGPIRPTNTEAAQADPQSYAAKIESQSKALEHYKQKAAERKEVKEKAQGAAPIAQPAPQVAQATAPTPAATPAQPAIAPSGVPTPAQPTLEEKAKSHATYPWEFTHRNKDWNPAVWYSLQPIKSRFGEEAGKYALTITPITSYKGQDLNEFYFAVKIGNQWIYALLPNQEYKMDLAKGQSVVQWGMYKADDNKKKLKFYSSVNREKKPKKVEKAARVEKQKKSEIAKSTPEKENLDQYLEPIGPKHLIFPRL